MTTAFYLHNQCDKSDRCRIMVRYSHASQVVRLKATMPDGTALRIPRDAWNGRRVKKTFPYHRLINSRLDEIEQQIENICFSLLAKGFSPVPDKVKQLYSEQGESMDPIKAYKAFIKHKGLSYESAGQYRTVLGRLEEMKPSWATFDEFFPDIFPRPTWGINTKSHYLSLIQEYLRFCKAKGWISNDLFEVWKMKWVKYPKPVFTIDEIQTLYDSPVSLGRDLMLWCIFSGMRHGETLREMYLEGDIVIFHREKGRHKKFHRVKMNSILMEIWERYNGTPAVPKIGEAIAKIREACQIAGINGLTETKEGLKPKHEVVTTHTGRRTFATIARGVGIPTADVQRVFDHASLATTQVYDQSGAEIGFRVMDTIETKIIQLIKQA